MLKKNQKGGTGYLKKPNDGTRYRIGRSNFLSMRNFLLAATALLASACMVGGSSNSSSSPSTSRSVAPLPAETHFRSLKQITFGGENAEAYFSHDGKWLTLQSTRDGRTCDQQYVMRIDGSGVRRISDGRGKTTCGWFFPGDNRLFFASSSAHDSTCPPRPDPSKGYVWPLDRYDIYTIDRDGSNLRRLTHYDVYTAEGVLSPDGSRIVFTSLKDGDLDIYTMNADGKNVRRLTNEPLAEQISIRLELGGICRMVRPIHYLLPVR